MRCLDENINNTNPCKYQSIFETQTGFLLRPGAVLTRLRTFFKDLDQFPELLDRFGRFLASLRSFLPGLA